MHTGYVDLIQLQQVLNSAPTPNTKDNIQDILIFTVYLRENKKGEPAFGSPFFY
jgi:hypothetical protein